LAQAAYWLYSLVFILGVCASKIVFGRFDF
jgi:hypothetical protein